MLKTKRGSTRWLITQPDHGELAGRMAAHWGNDEFARPGGFAPCGDPDRLRDEVVLAIAEHDNGWWEWEADPQISSEDGLPAGLTEVIESPVSGMNRWRLGVPRLADQHPYASLLIGDHAFWLYAAQFEPEPAPEMTHSLQRARRLYPSGLKAEALAFMAEMRELQAGFQRRLEQDEFWRQAAEPEQRYPNARLLQTLDAFSLVLCSTVIAPVADEARGLGEDRVVFENVPRSNWGDRVSIEFTPLGDGRIAVDPYPFDREPLELSVPARVAEPHTDWRRAPWVLRRYQLVRKGS